MTKVTVTTKLTAPAEEVWRLVGAWNALPEWHPAIQTSELEEGGRRRRLRLVDGGEITEELETFDGQRRMYSYSIVAGSLPVSDYRSTVSVNRAGEESTIEWTTTFKPLGVAESEISQSLEDFYQAGFDNLRKLLGIPR